MCWFNQADLVDFTQRLSARNWRAGLFGLAALRELRVQSDPARGGGVGRGGDWDPINKYLSEFMSKALCELVSVQFMSNVNKVTKYLAVKSSSTNTLGICLLFDRVGENGATIFASESTRSDLLVNF